MRAKQNEKKKHRNLTYSHMLAESREYILCTQTLEYIQIAAYRVVNDQSIINISCHSWTWTSSSTKRTNSIYKLHIYIYALHPWWWRATHITYHSIFSAYLVSIRAQKPIRLASRKPAKHILTPHIVMLRYRYGWPPANTRHFIHMAEWVIKKNRGSNAQPGAGSILLWEQNIYAKSVWRFFCYASMVDQWLILVYTLFLLWKHCHLSMHYSVNYQSFCVII